MSRPEAIEVSKLRARLVSVLVDEPNAEGSLYLHVLGCCYLACDEESPDEAGALEALFTTQAEIESVDSDDLLTGLCLAEVPS